MRNLVSNMDMSASPGGRGSAEPDVLPVLKPIPPPRTVGQHSIRLARSVYSGHIASALREAIVDGTIPEGTRLVEHQLASEWSVSRGPVRSALHVLQSEGLVRTLPNGRIVAVAFDPHDLADLLGTRHELESSAVRHGIEIGADTAPISRAFEAMEHERGSTDRLVELDIEFHRRIVEFGGSRFLLTSWLVLAPVLQAVITIGNRRLAREDPAFNRERILESHRRVLEPLVRGDTGAVIAELARQFSLTQSQFSPQRTHSEEP